MAINTIMGFSDKPLRLTVKVGFFITLLSVLVAIVYLGLYLSGRIQVEGFTTLILSLWFLSGFIMFILGILGLYIGRMFEKVKERPVYLIQDKCNI